MKLACPVCQSHLKHERTEDSFCLSAIGLDGVVTEEEYKSNGSTHVYCAANKDHDIPDELSEKIQSLLEE